MDASDLIVLYRTLYVHKVRYANFYLPLYETLLKVFGKMFSWKLFKGVKRMLLLFMNG